MEASVCDNANSALEFIHQQNFDLLLTDQSISGRLGSDLARHIRN
ncbi:MAG TPA: hypothetical protein DCW35_07840 [Polynucleobacter sp.]|nr:hypothetical protein [Polynucleobacter sp.]